MAGSGLAETRYVEQGELRNADFDSSDSGYFGNPIGQRLWRALHESKDIRELVSFVIGDAGFLERAEGADRKHERGRPSGDNERDGKRLRPKPADVMEHLDVEGAHRVTS